MALGTMSIMVRLTMLKYDDISSSVKKVSHAAMSKEYEKKEGEGLETY